MTVARQAETAGTAYQIVAQAAAIAVQDSADYLRYVTAVSAAVQSAALTVMFAKKDFTQAATIAAAQEASTKATAQFEAVGTAAGKVLAAFPAG